MHSHNSRCRRRQPHEATYRLPAQGDAARGRQALFLEHIILRARGDRSRQNRPGGGILQRCRALLLGDGSSLA